MSSEGETNRFENIAFQVEVGGNFAKSCDRLKEWMIQNKIKRE
jgi:hypothetical protein